MMPKEMVLDVKATYSAMDLNHGMGCVLKCLGEAWRSMAQTETDRKSIDSHDSTFNWTYCTAVHLHPATLRLFGQ